MERQATLSYDAMEAALALANGWTPGVQETQEVNLQQVMSPNDPMTVNTDTARIAPGRAYPLVPMEGTVPIMDGTGSNGTQGGVTPIQGSMILPGSEASTPRQAATDDQVLTVSASTDRRSLTPKRGFGAGQEQSAYAPTTRAAAAAATAQPPTTKARGASPIVKARGASPPHSSPSYEIYGEKLAKRVERMESIYQQVAARGQSLDRLQEDSAEYARQLQGTMALPEVFNTAGRRAAQPNGFNLMEFEAEVHQWYK